MPRKAISTTRLVFTGDFQQNVTDEIKSGAEVTILFDSNRLPFERSLDKKGKPEWTISAFYQASSESPVTEIKLVPEKTKKVKSTAEDNFLKGVFTVSGDSDEAIIWFQNTGKSGNVYFDSAFGRNYRFPVVTATEPAPVTKARAKKA